MLFLFLLVSMYLLSSLDEIYVRVKLLVDDLWEAKYDQTGFFGVGVDSFKSIILEMRPISLPVVQNSTKNRKYDKWG